MGEISHEQQVSKAILDFFEKKFPLEKRKFKSRDEILDYYVDLEVQLSVELKSLLESIKPVSVNKIKIANTTLLENLIISFELNRYSASITKIIRNKYTDISQKIENDLKNAKNIESFITGYVAKKLKEYDYQFYSSLVKKFKREEFPDFLRSKYIQLIRNKFLNLLSERNIDVSYFYFSDKIISLIDVYQEIFIDKKSFIFNAKNNKECLLNYFLLILLSNNKTFKIPEMKYLERLIQDFEYFAYMFNLSSLFEIKDFDKQYNLNKLFDELKKEYIDISEEVAEKKKKEIASKIIGKNENEILNIILSYCLVMNYLITRNKNTGEVDVAISDNYTSFASMKILLDNTLKNFDLIVDTQEIQDFAQSVLIKDIFASKGYIENKQYNIQQIKEILINNKKNEKLQKISQDFLKNLFVNKHHRILEFILNQDQNFKDKNVRRINLSPLNPRLTSNHCYIFISGFLSENSDHYEEWENMALNISANNTCYFYNWPGDCLSNAAGETLFNLGLTVLGDIISNNNKEKNKDKNTDKDIDKDKNKDKDKEKDKNKEKEKDKDKDKEELDCTNNDQNNKIENKFDNKIDNNNNTKKEQPKKKFDLAKSFIDSSNKAALSGKILAHIIASKLFFKYQTITLVGFSLGTHVSKHCLKKMYELHYKEHIPCNDIIKNVILIAGATSILGKEEKFKNIFSKMINGKLINCYSKEDQVLNNLYRGCMKKEPIGNNKLVIEGYENLKNIDFTPLRLGHTDYRAKMDLVMNKVDLYL